MEKKYKLLENEIIKIKDDADNLRTLYRIEALVDIRDDVPAGSKGGFIEKEDNLSQFGGCWVFDDAKVFDNARVCEDAIVYDSAVVMDNAICSGISQIYGNANVSGFAEIRNDARIFENAIVNGCAVVDSHARVYGVSTVGGMSTVTDVAQVFDESSIKCGYISKDAQVGGSVIIDGNTIIGDSGIIKSPNDFINISGIGANCETMTAYRTKNGTTNVIYGGGFIGGLGEFTKYISDPTIFGDNTTEELKTIIESILNDKYNLPTVKEVISILVYTYFVQSKEKNVLTMSFVSYSITPKPNTKDPHILKLKAIIEEWLNSGSVLYRKRKHRVATRNDYNKALLMYFALAVYQANK